MGALHTQPPRVEAIKRAVAAEYGLPVGIMSEPDGAFGSRQRVNARPRQVAITLALRLTEHSFVRIGQFFGGRDHSTVISAMRVTERRSRTDAELHNAMRRITLSLLRKGHE